jgi:hypothetical protein
VVTIGPTMTPAYVKTTANLLIALMAFCNVFSQDSTSLVDRITNFPNKIFNRIQNKAADLNNKLNRQTERYLNKLIKQENRLQAKLNKQDSLKTSQLYASNPQQQYASLIQRLKTDSLATTRVTGAEYLPYVDSMKGTLSFLKQNPQLLSSTNVLPSDIQNSLAQIAQLQAKMQNADQINQFIGQRKAQIQQWLAGYNHLPSGVGTIYQHYNEELYYYNEQVKQYKDILNDPDKMMQMALMLLDKVPAFTNYIKNNSILSTLFLPNGNIGTIKGLDGLQTKDQTNSMIQTQMGGVGPSGVSSIQQNMETAQNQLNQLKGRLSSLGTGNGGIDIPDFRPNTEKTKTFLKRLVYGINIQTQQATNFFPTLTDIGLSIGYKLNSGNTIGIGASYNIGWGSDFKHINFSSQGIGLRSFLDLQIKKSLFISGGLEFNYQQPFSSYQQIRSLQDWQESGLIGLSKTIALNTKFIKNTKIQIFWNFLSYSQIPRTQPFLFRVGYGF